MVSTGIGAHWWRIAVGMCLVTTGSLAVGGCGSSKAAALVCPAGAATGKTPAGSGTAPPGGNDVAVAAGWSLPGGNSANTRDVAGAITSANVSRLGVAWTVPLRIPVTHTDGAYASNPVVVHGVVYLQDLESDVLAIDLATGKVLWQRRYDAPNGGPDGVTVADGVVYGATNRAAFALSAATGNQLWTRTLIRNDHEGIDMAPGYDHGTVYVSTNSPRTTSTTGTCRTHPCSPRPTVVPW